MRVSSLEVWWIGPLAIIGHGFGISFWFWRVKRWRERRRERSKSREWMDAALLPALERERGSHGFQYQQAHSWVQGHQTAVLLFLPCDAMDRSSGLCCSGWVGEIGRMPQQIEVARLEILGVQICPLVQDLSFGPRFVLWSSWSKFVPWSPDLSLVCLKQQWCFYKVNPRSWKAAFDMAGWYCWWMHLKLCMIWSLRYHMG